MWQEKYTYKAPMAFDFLVYDIFFFSEWDPFHSTCSCGWHLQPIDLYPEDIILDIVNFSC